MPSLAPIVGSRAPDFTLPSTRAANRSSGTSTLSDYRDHWLVLFFYPRDFSLVCPTELSAMSSRIAEFEQRDCEILGVSTDSVATHERWITMPRSQGGLGGLNFMLASDETGETCRAYEVHIARQNTALRGLFVIDPNGVIQYQVVHNMSVGRSVDELLRVIDALQSGGMCPEAWSPGTATIDPLSELWPHRVVGNYRIESEIGRGAFGIVFRALDTLLDRLVALKIFRPDSTRPVEELLREARMAAVLNHPNICTIYTVDASAGAPVIVMELIEGRTLDEILAAGPPSQEEAHRLAIQIASGLAAAHAAGVAHGDLKPANILVRNDGVAKLMDFGLAQRTVSNASLSETMMGGGLTGTPYYMSPEQTRGEPPSPTSDIFSFGLILFELLTARRAIAGAKLAEVLHNVNHLDVDTLLLAVPSQYANAMSHMLSRDPASRSLGITELLST